MTTEFEAGIIADLLDKKKDTSRILEAIREKGLKPEAFTDTTNRSVFRAILAANSTDTITLRKAACEATGDNEFTIKALENISLTICDAVRRVEDKVETTTKNAVNDTVRLQMTLASQYPNAADFAESMCTAIRTTMAKYPCSGSAANEAVSFADLADPTPEEENPAALFKNGWLRKGHALVLVSTSGVGKSVITVQLAYAWARGLAAFGIQPLRPLRIGFLQTEDDMEEMQEFRQHIRRGYRAAGWSDDDLAEAERNLGMPRDFAAPTGEDFVNYMRRWQRRNKFDLIIVNPLQGVCGCDIANNADLRHFVRDLIDPVIKDKENGCALMIVHHTNKPPSGHDRGGFGTDRYAEYVGAGGAELTNWMRAMLAIIPTKEGVFNLVAPKRGQRLKWPKQPGDKSHKPRKCIAHSEGGLIFWREVDDVPLIEHADAAKSSDAPPADSLAHARILAEKLKEEARTLTEARELAKELFGRKDGKKAYDDLISNLEELGVVIRPTGHNNQKLIGSHEGVENLYFIQCEKQAAELCRKTSKK